MILIDTSALVSRYLAKDDQHVWAVYGWRTLQSGNEPIFTTNLILLETTTLLSRYAGNDFAQERAKRMYDSAVLKVERAQEEDELEAIGLLSKYKDHRISFTDCISFVLMKKMRCRRAFTFDTNFKVAGFEMWP